MDPEKLKLHKEAMVQLDMFSKGGQVWKRKKKKKTLSNWKQRYFLLKGGHILYYATVNDIKPLGEFDLVVTQVKRLDESDTTTRIKDANTYKYVFQLSTFNSEYHIATETEEELLQWLNMINRVKTHIFSNGLDLGPSHRAKPQKRGIGSRLTLRGKKQNFDGFNTIHNFSSASNTNSSPRIFNSSGMKGREAVIEEIMATERDYVKDLILIKEHFIFKLQDYGLMQKNQKDAIFGNIEELIPLHSKLLEELENEYQQQSPNFGEIFANVVSSSFSFFKIVKKKIILILILFCFFFYLGS